jgi:H-type lectin domain-containing protein
MEHPIPVSRPNRRTHQLFEAFKSAPTVTASISTADLDKNENFRLRVWVTDVDSKGFTIHAAVWGGTKLYQCVVSWIVVGN